MAGLETKHNPVLVVHANAIEPLPLAPQLLQPVGRRHAQILDSLAGVQDVELVRIWSHNCLGSFSCGFRVHAVINILRSLIRKRNDHSNSSIHDYRVCRTVSLMAAEIARIAEQLRRAVEGGAWHGPSVMETLAGVDARAAAAYPIKGAHSIWEILNHITAWTHAIVRRLNGEAVELQGADDWPPVTDGSEPAWQAAIASFRAAQQELLAKLKAMSNARARRPSFPARTTALPVHAARRNPTPSLSRRADGDLEEGGGGLELLAFSFWHSAASVPPW